MTLAETAFAILLLLATPGPTNTLLALAGAERGWGRATRLIPAELAGYLLATLPLAIVGAQFLGSVPLARSVVTVLAALWVLWLAIAMWRLPVARGARPSVTGRRVFLTTLLNPKGLVFGLVLLPAADPSRVAANFGLFAALVAGGAAGWAGLGAALHRPTGATGELHAGWRRAASLWLGVLGVYLLGRVAGLA